MLRIHNYQPHLLKEMGKLLPCPRCPLVSRALLAVCSRSGHPVSTLQWRAADSNSVTNIAPTIITTAPTSRSLEPPKRKKNKFQFVSSREKAISQAWDSNTEGRTGSRSGASPQLSPSRKPASPELGPSITGQEDAGRLSTSSWRHVDDFPHPLEPDVRFSESSRSDRSSAVYLNGVKGNGAHPQNKGFRLPRLKRNRGPLFPLPVKIPPPVSVNSPSVNDTHSPSTTSNDADGPVMSVDRTKDQDHLSPLPSPSHSLTGLSSARAGSSVPALFRKDSTKSVHSANSLSSAHGQRNLGGRGRSSTINSLVDIQGDPRQSSTNLASLAQTPTPTSGRKSFGDIFNLSQRFRQNSEVSALRNGCSNGGTPRTPTSYSISRDAISYPEREDGDTPAAYLTRLGEVVHRGLIATILSKSDEDFYKTSLRKYMRSFSFFGDPIDMAIRKLLMQVELPKETQQIDRVLQSFADRYHECNPGIFASAGKLISPSVTSVETTLIESTQIKHTSLHFLY